MFTGSVRAAVPLLHPAAADPAPEDARAAAPPGRRERLERMAVVAPAGPPAFAGASPFPGLSACIEETRAAATASDAAPPDPMAFAPLVARLEKASARLPPPYRTAVAEPLLRKLRDLGARGFARVLADDPGREGTARLLLDVAQAVLQRGEGYAPRATAAFQEVVSDLYDGFLSAEDRRGVKPPDRGVVPPLVRWGSGEDGPYTWTAPEASALGVGAAVVSLPAAHASRGLLAWAALAHETAGHDILAADDGLGDELARAVRANLLAEKTAPALADYWAERIDEAASDVLGVLNMGPAAAVGLVGYVRALNGAWNGRASLRNVGGEEDPHPADIVRAYLAAETVRLLSFAGAGRWADRLVAEADRDLGQIRLGGLAVSASVAKASAAAVARAIVRTRVAALEGHAIGEIQDWRDRDEAIVKQLRRPGGARAGAYVEGAYAAHAVASAIYEAVDGSSAPTEALARTIGVLVAMHDRNPAWRDRRAVRAGSAEAIV